MFGPAFNSPWGCFVVCNTEFGIRSGSCTGISQSPQRKRLSWARRKIEKFILKFSAPQFLNSKTNWKRSGSCLNEWFLKRYSHCFSIIIMLVLPMMRTPLLMTVIVMVMVMMMVVMSMVTVRMMVVIMLMIMMVVMMMMMLIRIIMAMIMSMMVMRIVMLLLVVLMVTVMMMMMVLLVRMTTRRRRRRSDDWAYETDCGYLTRYLLVLPRLKSATSLGSGTWGFGPWIPSTDSSRRLVQQSCEGSYLGGSQC